MSIVFLGCIYLIFKTSEDKKQIEHIGLNDAVPQATEARMQGDKQKAYEQEMLEEKDTENRNALTTLADYWDTDNRKDSTLKRSNEPDNDVIQRSNEYGNPTVGSYRNAQAALGSFYQDEQRETIELRRQLDDLKAQLAEKEVPKPATVDDQLTLMEKSYQMAAKYLPTTTNPSLELPVKEVIPVSKSH